MKSLGTTIAIVLISILSNAQKPLTSGYLGKTMFVNVKFNTGLTFSHPQKSQTVEEDIADRDGWPHSLKKEFELVVGKVMSNHLQLEVNYGRYNASILMDDGSYRGFGSDFIYGTDGRPLVTDNFFGVKVKLFSRNKGAIAPLGFYNAFQLNQHQYKLNFENVEFRTSRPSTTRTYLDYEQRIWKTTGFDFNWSLGMNRAVGEHILLDFGVATGLSLGVQEVENKENRVLDSYVQERFRNMLPRYYLNKVYFAVGFLF